MKHRGFLIACAVALVAMFAAKEAKAQEIREIVDPDTGSFFIIIAKGNVTPDTIVRRYDGVYRKALAEVGELEEGEHLTPEKIYRAEGNREKLIPVCLDERGLSKSIGSPGNEGVWRTCASPGKPSMVFIPGYRYRIPTQKMISYEAAKSLYLGIRKCFKADGCTIKEIAELATANGIVAGVPTTATPPATPTVDPQKPSANSTDSSGELARLKARVNELETKNASLLVERDTARTERDDARKTSGQTEVARLKTELNDRIPPWKLYAGIGGAGGGSLIVGLVMGLVVARRRKNGKSVQPEPEVVREASGFRAEAAKALAVKKAVEGLPATAHRESTSDRPLDPKKTTERRLDRPGTKKEKKSAAEVSRAVPHTMAQELVREEHNAAVEARQNGNGLNATVNFDEPVRPNAGVVKTADESDEARKIAPGSEVKDVVPRSVVDEVLSQAAAVVGTLRSENAALQTQRQAAVDRATAAEVERSAYEARNTELESVLGATNVRAADLDQRLATSEARAKELEAKVACKEATLVTVRSDRNETLLELTNVNSALTEANAKVCPKPGVHGSIDGLRALYRKVADAQAIVASCHDDTRSALRKRFPVSDGSHDSDPSAAYSLAVSDLEKANRAFVMASAEVLGEDATAYAMFLDSVYTALRTPSNPPKSDPAPAPALEPTVAKSDTAPPESGPFREGDYAGPLSAGHQIAPKASPLPTIQGSDDGIADDVTVIRSTNDLGIGLTDEELESRAFAPLSPQGAPRPTTNPWLSGSDDQQAARPYGTPRQLADGKNGDDANRKTTTLAPPDLVVTQGALGGSMPFHPVASDASQSASPTGESAPGHPRVPTLPPPPPPKPGQ